MFTKLNRKQFLFVFFSRGLACLGSNKFHARYRCVEYALNAFGARFRQARVSYMYMLVPILLDCCFSNEPKACMRCAYNRFIAGLYNACLASLERNTNVLQNFHFFILYTFGIGLNDTLNKFIFIHPKSSSF